jgi:biopolymer transport protein TolR
MDIFTILVFFLMLNASDVQVLQNSKSVVLPESTAKQAARETLLLVVNNRDLILQGRKLADVAELLAKPDDIIAELATELTYQLGRSQQSTHTQDSANPAKNDEIGRAITIMGDKSIPYALLKRIMQTCAQAGFTDISLAVESLDVATTTTADNQP